MSRINFFTPVDYGQPSTRMQKFETAVDHYFYLGGRTACVLPRSSRIHSVLPRTNKVNLVEGEVTIWHTVLKVITYMTLILPALALTIKFAFRCWHSFHAVKRTYASGAVIEGEFSNGRLIRGVFNRGGVRLITAPRGFCDSFPNFGDAPYDGPTLNFVEFMQHNVLRFIPVKTTHEYGIYESYNNSLSLAGAEQATMDALLLMAQDPYGVNDIGKVLDHPRLMIEPNNFLILLSQGTGEGNQKNYHTIGTSIVMLEMLKRDPEGIYIQVDDALFDKWHDSYLNELKEELQRRRAPAQAVGQ